MTKTEERSGERAGGKQSVATPPDRSRSSPGSRWGEAAGMPPARSPSANPDSRGIDQGEQQQGDWGKRPKQSCEEAKSEQQEISEQVGYRAVADSVVGIKGRQETPESEVTTMHRGTHHERQGQEQTLQRKENEVNPACEEG